MYIDNLVLEVTRQCNLKCAHCLRGPAQRLKMTPAVLINSCVGHRINTVTFTGGEPSLACDVIEEFIRLVQYRNVSFDHFYVVTNAHTRNGFRRFLDLLDKLYQLAEEPSNCSLTVSQDQYHRNEHTIDLGKFNRNGWDDDPPYFYRDQRRFNIDNPITEGRAATNQLSWRPPEPQKLWDCLEHNGELNIDEGIVYVSANGNVTSDCDMSFRRIDRESKGNVLQTSLEDIIRSSCVIEQEESVAVTA